MDVLGTKVKENGFSLHWGLGKERKSKMTYKLIVKTATGIQTTGFESREMAQRAANRAMENGAIDAKVEVN